MRLSILLVILAACDPAGPGSSADGGLLPVDGMAPATCPANTLCMPSFLVKPETPVAAGRLVVVWFQPMDFQPMPVDVAYDVPFVPGAARYDIPIASVRAPATDRVLLCQWENNVCLHDSTPTPIGFGLPLVLDDENGNGRIDLAEVSFTRAYGVGQVYLGWSEAAHAVGSETLYKYDQLTIPGEIFTQGIAAGIHVYGLLDTGGFDVKLGAPDASTPMRPELALCPGPGSSCTVAPPHLVGLVNP